MYLNYVQVCVMVRLKNSNENLQHHFHNIYIVGRSYRYIIMHFTCIRINKRSLNYLFLVFAYGETYISILVARSLQGTASALISVSGI